MYTQSSTSFYVSSLEFVHEKQLWFLFDITDCPFYLSSLQSIEFIEELRD